MLDTTGPDAPALQRIDQAQVLPVHQRPRNRHDCLARHPQAVTFLGFDTGIRQRRIQLRARRRAAPPGSDQGGAGNASAEVSSSRWSRNMPPPIFTTAKRALLVLGKFLQVLLRFPAGTQLGEQFVDDLSYFSHCFLPIVYKSQGPLQLLDTDPLIHHVRLGDVARPQHDGRQCPPAQITMPRSRNPPRHRSQDRAARQKLRPARYPCHRWVTAGRKTARATAPTPLRSRPLMVSRNSSLLSPGDRRALQCMSAASAIMFDLMPPCTSPTLKQGRRPSLFHFCCLVNGGGHPGGELVQGVIPRAPAARTSDPRPREPDP